jgi:AraC-like DNA-binding protein
VPGSFVTAAPGPAARGAVHRYIGYTEAGAPVRRREVATGVVTVILSFGPRIRCDGVPHESFVAGLSDVPVTTEHDGEQAGIELNLDPLAARRVLGVPLRELTNEVVALEDVLAAPTLLEELAEAPGWPERFARLDAEIARRLDGAPAPHPGVRAACARLTASGGTLPVGRLAAELGWSRRHLGARFLDEVGVAPKTYARLVRFERAAALLARPEPDLAGVALSCGYYDQAHFNREFRALAGVAPGRFRAERLPFVQDEAALAA